MATIQVRVDDDLKQRAEALFAQIGIDTSAAIRLFLKQSVNYGGIPFQLRADPYDEYVRAALLEASEEAKNTDVRLTWEEVLTEARARINGI